MFWLNLDIKYQISKLRVHRRRFIHSNTIIFHNKCTNNVLLYLQWRYCRRRAMTLWHWCGTSRQYYRRQLECTSLLLLLLFVLHSSFNTIILFIYLLYKSNNIGIQFKHFILQILSSLNNNNTLNPVIVSN